MNLIEDIAGELCKILLPIREEIFFGNPNSNIAICTLSEINLLNEIANSSTINEISVAGRLFSENKGIDTMVKYVLSNEKIDTIILCGRDTMGHKSGHALLCLYKNGIDANQKIIGSQSPHPFLTLTKNQISKFQQQIKIIDKIGVNDISIIKNVIMNYKQN